MSQTDLSSSWHTFYAYAPASVGLPCLPKVLLFARVLLRPRDPEQQARQPVDRKKGIEIQKRQQEVNTMSLGCYASEKYFHGWLDHKRNRLSYGNVKSARKN
jgi:hypothetical protein